MIQIDIKTQKINEPIPGLDNAVYAGLAKAEGDLPQAHLVLWLNTPKTRQDFEGSIALAETVHPESNSHLPSQDESALLYAMVRERIEKDGGYWTSTYYDDDKDAAFVQLFTNGNQFIYSLNSERRALAVSRFPL